jgi:hypothetical protein
MVLYRSSSHRVPEPPRSAVVGNTAFGGENMVEERGHVKLAPPEPLPKGFGPRDLRKMQYKLHFAGSRRYFECPKAGNFAGGPSTCVLGTMPPWATGRIAHAGQRKRQMWRR